MSKNGWLDVRWSRIKRVQQLQVVRSMYIWLFVVPILVKSLSEINDKLTLHAFGETFPVYTTLPFSFWIFYFSAFLFVLSNVIYQLRCPQLIQDHDSWRSFAEHGKGEEHLQDYVRKIKIDKDDYDKAWEVATTGSPGGALQDQFWEFFKLSEKEGRAWRYCAHIFNILAFIAIAIVVLQNLYTVIKHAFA